MKERSKENEKKIYIKIISISHKNFQFNVNGQINNNKKTKKKKKIIKIWKRTKSISEWNRSDEREDVYWRVGKDSQRAKR